MLHSLPMLGLLAALKQWPIVVKIRVGPVSSNIIKCMSVDRCGRVMNVTIARDLQGKPRGFAHVEFSNELEAQNALSLSGAAHHVSVRVFLSLHPHVCRQVHVWARHLLIISVRNLRCPCRLHAAESSHRSHAQGQQAACALCAASIRGICTRPGPGARLLQQPGPGSVPRRLLAALLRARPLPCPRPGPPDTSGQQQVCAA